MGDGMMMKNVRILVATAAIVLLGAGVPLLAEESIPVIQGMGAEAGPSGPVLHLRATGEMETVHYSPQPGVWVVELPEAQWSEAAGRLTGTGTGIERAELDHVDEFGHRDHAADRGTVCGRDHLHGVGGQAGALGKVIDRGLVQVPGRR